MRVFVLIFDTQIGTAWTILCSQYGIDPSTFNEDMNCLLFFILHCRSSADRSEMIRIRADLIRADLDQGKKVLLICGFRSGSSADRSVLGLNLERRRGGHAPRTVPTGRRRRSTKGGRRNQWRAKSARAARVPGRRRK